MVSPDLLRQLLWAGKSRWQLFGALLGTFAGLLLLLLSLQFYHNVQQVIGGSQDKEDRFVLINKKVNLFNTLGLSPAFSETEIDQLKQQDFIKSVGVFTQNKYRVSASSALVGLYTELFFEALPDAYIDVQSDAWEWREGDSEVPIILSRDYLALYNFGFAPSQGLPQFTPNTIRRLSFDLTLKGEREQKVLKGRIIGFSDRINSILVPLSFMEWSNARYGNRETSQSSRLILECDNVYSKDLESFLVANNYDLSRGRFIGGPLQSILGMILAILAAIGFLLLGLSLLVFLLNFQLLIAQSAQDIRYLLQLGYPSQRIREVLHRRLFLYYGGVLVAVGIGLVLGQKAMIAALTGQGFSLSFALHWTVWLVALVSVVLLLFFNYRNIRREVEGLFG